MATKHEKDITKEWLTAAEIEENLEALRSLLKLHPRAKVKDQSLHKLAALGFNFDKMTPAQQAETILGCLTRIDHPEFDNQPLKTLEQIAHPKGKPDSIFRFDQTPAAYQAAIAAQAGPIRAELMKIRSRDNYNTLDAVEKGFKVLRDGFLLMDQEQQQKTMQMFFDAMVVPRNTKGSYAAKMGGSVAIDLYLAAIRAQQENPDPKYQAIKDIYIETALKNLPALESKAANSDGYDTGAYKNLARVFPYMPEDAQDRTLKLLFETQFSKDKKSSGVRALEVLYQNPDASKPFADALLRLIMAEPGLFLAGPNAYRPQEVMQMVQALSPQTASMTPQQKAMTKIILIDGLMNNDSKVRDAAFAGLQGKNFLPESEQKLLTDLHKKYPNSLLALQRAVAESQEHFITIESVSAMAAGNFVAADLFITKVESEIDFKTGRMVNKVMLNGSTQVAFEEASYDKNRAVKAVKLAAQVAKEK